jgi:hypothetical protein
LFLVFEWKLISDVLKLEIRNRLKIIKLKIGNYIRRGARPPLSAGPRLKAVGGLIG